MDQQWNATYQNNIIPALKRLRKVQGVILGFHSVIDGIKRVKSDEIETILNTNLDLKQSVQEKIYAMPTEIFSPADMMAGLLISIKTFDWIFTLNFFNFSSIFSDASFVSSKS